MLRRARRNGRDDRWRALERRAKEEGGVENYAAVLAEKVRAGELSMARVVLAAELGRPDAALVAPDFGYVNWETEPGRTESIARAARLLGRPEIPGLIASEWAARVVPVYERVYPDDDSLWVALEEWDMDRAWSAYLAAADADAESAALSVYHALDGGAASASRAASYAALADHSQGAEANWQRERLAAYVLGDLP